MAFTPDGNNGALNGTTPVTLIAAPSAGVARMMKIIRVTNRDTIAHTFTLRFVSGANTRRLWYGTLAVGDSVKCDDPLVLDSTESITALLGEAIATTNPDFVSSWADYS